MSKKAQSALNNYHRQNPNLHSEIKKHTGMIYGLKDDGTQELSMSADCDDNADVSSSAVIKDALDLVVPDRSSEGSVCVTWTPSGGLTAGGEGEDVWAWNNGEKWGDELPAE
jgi:hypothetical protein